MVVVCLYYCSFQRDHTLMLWKRKTLKRLRIIHYHRLFLLQRKILTMNQRKYTLSDADDHDGQIVVCFSVFLHTNVCSVNITILLTHLSSLIWLYQYAVNNYVNSSILSDGFLLYIFVNRSYFLCFDNFLL